MPLQLEEQDGVTVVTVDVKRLDASVADGYRQELQKLIDEGKVRLCLDMAGVDFIDSSGLNVLIVATRNTRGKKGDLRLASPAPKVMSLLQMTRLDKMIPIHPTRAEAVAAAKG